MTGIVIAAGRGTRMLPYISDRPKCMLPVRGRPLLAYALERLRAAGCGEIVIVTGHLADLIEAPGCTLVHNGGFKGNNILHSLMHARASFDDELLVTYSDILVEPFVYQELANADGDIVVSIDVDWRKYYVGRSDHPVTEAENAVVRASGTAHGVLESIGKHVIQPSASDKIFGEFTGLWKMSRDGARLFRDRFDELDRALDSTAAFQTASEWRQAYVTDMFTDLIERQGHIECLLIRQSWAELDTAQDYHRLSQMIESQRLFSLRESEAFRS